MAKYYAYIPREDGTEPMGTENRILFERKGDTSALAEAIRRLGRKLIVLISYTNLYDDSTFRVIRGEYKQ